MLEKSKDRLLAKLVKDYKQVSRNVAWDFSVADLTALAAVLTAVWPAFTRCYVTGVADVYVLVKTGSYTHNGASIIRATDLGGYWLSTTYGRWTDIQGDVSQGVGTSALTYEVYRDTTYSMYFFRHDQDDRLSMRMQLPHEWNKATAVVPHLHVIPLADPPGPGSLVVKISGRWAWADVGQVVPANASWTAFDVSHTVAPGDIYKPTLISLGSVSPTVNAKESSILMLIVQRLGSTDPTDTYTTSKTGGTAAANLGLLSFDLHYRKDKHGTLDEIPA